MTSRERVLAALAHRQPDLVPLDLGGMPASGMAVSSVHKLKVALGLCRPNDPVKVVEPFLMLGEIDEPLRRAVGADVVSTAKRNVLGLTGTGWKEWRLFDGTPVLVPDLFNTDPEPNGDIFQYPMGDKTATPCARMPKDGFYFDAINRQPPLDEDHLRVEDNVEEFRVLSAADLERYRTETAALRKSGYAVVVPGPGMAFGDVNHVPGMLLRSPKGIRDVEEWYVSLMIRREHIREIFRRQCDIALENLKLLWQAIGENADIFYTSGADFGTQNGPLMAPKDYCDLFQPFNKKLNDWIHQNTTWKTMQHTCGAVEPLIDHFIDAGFDILNPVQTSAAGMEPRGLKKKYGSRTTFWGGGVDTQHVLPFGTPDEIRRQVKERVEIFGPGGGFVFTPVHNVQAGIPVENLVALYDAFREYR